MDSLGLVFLALLSSRWISPCYVQPLDLFLDPTAAFLSSCEWITDGVVWAAWFVFWSRIVGWFQGITGVVNRAAAIRITGSNRVTLIHFLIFLSASLFGSARVSEGRIGGEEGDPYRRCSILGRSTVERAWGCRNQLESGFGGDPERLRRLFGVFRRFPPWEMSYRGRRETRRKREET